MRTETEQIIRLQTQRFGLLERLIAPARAAAAQMKDAGMREGSAPLLQMLFELDANESERHQCLDAIPTSERIHVLMELVSGAKGQF